MRFLLTALNAKYIHTNPALYSLRAYAAKEGRGIQKHIVLEEYTINQRSHEILSGIYKQKPDVIAFSCYIWNIAQVLSLVRELHKILPHVPIWLGGPEVSYCAGEVLKSYPELTGVMVGEGEETFLELLRYYAEGIPGDMKAIKGIVFRAGSEIVSTGERELTDLNSLPFLYEDLGQFEHRIIYYESSRGCPFRCSYCLSSIDKRVRLRDLETVKRELQFFLDRNVPQVKFIDRTFNCNHEHAMEIWRYIREHDNGITNFHFEIAADLLNEEELTLLQSFRPGAVQMEIGVQTTNPETLLEIRRCTDMDRLKQVMGRLHEGKNIHIHLDLIAGLPYEDYQSFRRSFDEVCAMEPEQLQLGFLKVLSGSYMAEKCEDYGLLFTDAPPYEVLQTKWLSYADICRLKQVEQMVELYYNSNQFTRTLPYLERFFDSPFVMFERLGAFYERKGLFVSTPSRIYRYQALLDFALEEAGADKELLQELLTLDVYLRENAKSRPDFARDLRDFKEKTGVFYRLKENRAFHLEPFFYDVCTETPTYERLEKEQYLVFDYGNRNPLTYEAATFIWEEPEEK